MGKIEQWWTYYAAILCEGGLGLTSFFGFNLGGNYCTTGTARFRGIKWRLLKMEEAMLFDMRDKLHFLYFFDSIIYSHHDCCC